LVNRLLVERPTRTTPPPTPAPTTLPGMQRFIGRDDTTGPFPIATVVPPTVVPITVGTKVEEAERQLALRTLQPSAGDRAPPRAALRADPPRLDDLLGPPPAAHPAVPHN